MTNVRPPTMADVEMMREAVQGAAVAVERVSQRLRVHALMPCTRVAAMTDYVAGRLTRAVAAPLLPKEVDD